MVLLEEHEVNKDAKAISCSKNAFIKIILYLPVPLRRFTIKEAWEPSSTTALRLWTAHTSIIER